MEKKDEEDLSQNKFCDKQSQKVDELVRRYNSIILDNHSVDLQITRVEGDVKHIKEKIDNGLSTVVFGLDKKLDAFIMEHNKIIYPAVKDNSFWIGIIKRGFAYLVITVLCGGTITLFFWIIKTKLI